MPQKRWFKVTRNVSGITSLEFVETHTPKDFLGDVGETPKPGKEYVLRDGCNGFESVTYNKIKTRAEFDALKAEYESYVDADKAASVKQASAVAQMSVPRPGRKSGKGVYGVITKQRDTIARLERKLEQKQALIDNARIREQELRIQFGG